MIGAAGCRSEPSPRGADALPSEPAPRETEAGSGASAGEGSGPDEADRAFVELKAAAKRLVAADRAVLNNRRGYEQAVERHRRDLALFGLNARIPTSAISPGLVEARIRDPAREAGLTVRSVKVGEADEPPPVPAEHRGEGPYRYDVDQVVARHPVTITVTPADEQALRSFFRRALAGEGLMLDLVGVRIEGDEATFSGQVVRRRDVTPPVHVVETPGLEALADEVGVQVPTGHPRVDEVRALLDEHREMEAKLASAMKALGRAHLLGRLFQFHRGRAKAIERRPFPEPVRVEPSKPQEP
ncbi:MAG: hypothetical protein ACQEXJ_00735 [Myxococcota bacterium]